MVRTRLLLPAFASAWGLCVSVTQAEEAVYPIREESVLDGEGRVAPEYLHFGSWRASSADPAGPLLFPVSSIRSLRRSRLCTDK